MKDKSLKFDVISFANKTADWNILKDIISKSIENKKRLLLYVETLIRENFSGFSFKELLDKSQGVITNHSMYFDKINNKIVYKFDYSIKVLNENYSVNMEFIGKYITKEYNGKIYHNWMQFENNYETKYKNEFIKLHSLLSYNIGCNEMLIQDTDIIVKILQNKRLNRGFKGLSGLKYIRRLNTELKSTYEEYKKQRRLKIEAYNENKFLQDKNENLKKQMGFISQYFEAWESEIINVPKGKRKDFYNVDFISERPDLKKVLYESFINNYKVNLSLRKKALMNKG
jgi:hypothetical protein